MNRPISERRKFLVEHMVEVGNNVKFSEVKLITKKSELSDMIKDVLQQGLEGEGLVVVAGVGECSFAK
jgi:hypothetical protein